MSAQTFDSSPVPVLLLKTKSVPADKYEETFNGADGHYRASFVPVLDHRFKQDSVLWFERTVLNHGFSHATKVDGAGAHDTSYFGGIIFTSQRAVEAFASIVEPLDSATKNILLPTALPLYVVGPATARGLRALNLQCQIVGEETGNGEALSAFMLDHYNKLPTAQTTLHGQKLPLLFPVGEQRRDIIPRTLQSTTLDAASRIGVEEVIVYETGEMESFPHDFSSAIEENTRAGSKKQWVVVFSPQGCKAMLRCLKWLDEATGRFDPALVKPQAIATYIATIGPTTRDFLIKELDFEPSISAGRPSPEGIFSAINSYKVT
ncbi:hypothetical protein MBLNU459_g6799t1 [Dothideomycetes sp. NU459]